MTELHDKLRPDRQTGGEAYVVIYNAALVHRVVDEIWNAGNLDLADELFAPTYINHGGLISDLVRGPEGIKFSVALYRAAFPGLHVAVDDLRVDNDRVTLRWTAGNRVRDGAEIDAARTDGTLTGRTSSQVVNGQVVESWTSWDPALVLQRLGVVSAVHEETS
jgi:predicted SnoaL-like aldol condensation-catalyzing enzyme